MKSPLKRNFGYRIEVTIRSQSNVSKQLKTIFIYLDKRNDVDKNKDEDKNVDGMKSGKQWRYCDGSLKLRELESLNRFKGIWSNIITVELHGLPSENYLFRPMKYFYNARIKGGHIETNYSPENLELKRF